MNPILPDWTAFEPYADRLPVGIGGDGTEIPGAGLIAFVVDDSVDSEWAAEASITLAKLWVGGGAKVFLADLFLDDPVLNNTLGVENGDGVTDVFMYGASIRHVAKPIQAGGYLLATAGTAVADGSVVLSHERWGPVLDGFREAGVLLIAFVPADALGLDSLLARAAGVVHLAGSVAGSVSTSTPVLARLGPAEEAEAVSSPTDSYPTADSSGTDESPGVDELSGGDESSAAEESTETGGMFNMADLPGPEAEAESESEGGEIFSMDALGGDQYGAGDGGGVSEPEAAPTEDVEATSESEDFDFGGELEIEAPAAVEEEPSLEVREEEPEPDGMPSMEVESSMLMDDSTMDSLVSSSSMMEGIETGSGFEMPGTEDGPATDIGAGPEVESQFGAEAEPVSEIEAGVEEGFDFGGEMLEVDDPSESGDARQGMVDRESDSPPVAEPDDDFGALQEDAADDDAPFLDPSAELASPGGVASDNVEAGEEPSDREATGGVPDAVDVETPEHEAAAVQVPTKPGKKRVTEERKLTGLEKLERAQKRKARMRTAMIALATLVVAGGGGYGLMVTGIISVPGITPDHRLRSGISLPTELPGPTPSTPVMSYSLLTQSYNDFVTAWKLAGSLETRLPDAMFFVAPVAQNDRTRWGLFAGPAYSAVEAEALRQPVDDAFANNFDATVWRVSESNYAFFFGEYGDMSEAQNRVDGLLGQEIPSYVLQVDYADLPSGYRVYGGAYIDEFQAVPMGELLREHGITDIPLTERRGKRPE